MGHFSNFDWDQSRLHECNACKNAHTSMPQVRFAGIVPQTTQQHQSAFTFFIWNHLTILHRFISNLF